MMSRRLSPARAILAVSLTLVTGCRPEPANVVRVCADPNNLPFSDSTGAGFENRLAAIVAAELDAKVEYTWWAQRRGFIRNTLNARQCDVVMGVPTSFELALVTRPYYRSTYVFVSRRDRALRVRSFDDSVLRNLTIGVQLVGDDYTNAPPAHALARRGIVNNVRGYNVQGDYTQPAPPARIIDAVARGDIDLAVAWGPLAGYFASRAPVPLDLVPVTPQVDLPFLPFVFDISMGVRRADSTLRDTLDAIILRRRASIDSLLDSYGVPLLGVRRAEPAVATVDARAHR
ncbi:MAG TPA: substrate-binding domain-containing protein [Gemmatimonadaceae bacterium]|nr:substrate-binding domain-containing protein [Gemmatimonadaceae bacterium]